MLLSAAGTRPEPAVSVPSASGTMPAATATAEPRARAAGDQAAIERVARHAIGRAHADEPGGKLVEVGLADDDGARRLEARDQVASRPAHRQKRDSRPWWQARDVDVVLHRDRDAEERKVAVASSGKRGRLRNRLALIAQRNEHRGVGVRADAGVAVGDCRLRARRTAAVGRDYCRNPDARGVHLRTMILQP